MNNKPHEQAIILLALDVLNFDAGDWKPESIERHLREQIEMARNHLKRIVDGDTAACIADHDAEVARKAISHVASNFDFGEFNCKLGIADAIDSYAHHYAEGLHNQKKRSN